MAAPDPEPSLAATKPTAAETASVGLAAPAIEHPAPVVAAAHDPAADLARQLQPVEVAPLVGGAPLSVAEPVAAQRINTLFGIGALILLVATVVVVVLLAVFVINLLVTR